MRRVVRLTERAVLVARRRFEIRAGERLLRFVRHAAVRIHLHVRVEAMRQLFVAPERATIVGVELHPAIAARLDV